MTASTRLVVIDDDEGTVVRQYVLDNFDTVNEAIVFMDGCAEQSYSNTGIVPRELDGTPYWGESDENEVNQ